MDAARYWRLVGIEAAGGDLELSELHLYGASGRLDATATLTSTIAPTAGTLAALQDDNLGTTCRFAGAAVRSGGFALVWDFGAGNTADAVGVRLGAAAQDVFMAGCTLQYSTDGARWVWIADFARYEWPGADAYTLAPAVGEQDYNKVALLLHCDGADDSTTFTDKSPSPKTFAAYGGAKIATAQSKFGGASLRTSSGGLYLSGGENPLDMGVSDFTVECWLRPDTSAAGAIINNYGTEATLSGFVVQSNGGGVVAAYFYSGSTAFAATSAAGKLAAGVWQHLAVVRHGASFVLYLNGLNIASASVGTSVMNAVAAPMRIGMESNTGAYPISAYFDELRVTKGSARYTASFTPPTAPFPDTKAAGGTLFLPPTVRTADSAVQIAASAPVPAFSTRHAPALTLARDVEFGGSGTIYGTTKTKGSPANTPTKARVVLLHQRSKQPVRETWSDPVTGAFAFTGIDINQQFLTLAEDAAGNFRPVASSRLVPEVLP